MNMNPVIMPAMPTHLNDQATALRELVSGMKDSARMRERITGVRSIAVLSGKGGVGKSNVAVNVALALGAMGLNVTLLDADLGLANIDILFGVVPKFNLGHVLKGDKDLSDIIFKVDERLSIIPGGAGLRELADLDEQGQSWMIDRLSKLEDDADLLILDMSAGIHKNVISFAMASDLSLLITTPEPTAIRDSYSVLKTLCQASDGDINIGLVVNMTSSEREAFLVSERITSAAEQFLDFRVPYFGCVIWDSALRDSVRKRKPLMLEDVESASVPYFKDLAQKIYDSSEEGQPLQKPNKRDSFLLRLLRHAASKERQ
jgi:flagellar biosynthesis protein FlhG